MHVVVSPVAASADHSVHLEWFQDRRRAGRLPHVVHDAAHGADGHTRHEAAVLEVHRHEYARSQEI